MEAGNASFGRVDLPLCHACKQHDKSTVFFLKFAVAIKTITKWHPKEKRANVKHRRKLQQNDVLPNARLRAAVPIGRCG